MCVAGVAVVDNRKKLLQSQSWLIRIFFYCVLTMTIFNAVFQFIIMSSNFTITRSNNT